MIDQTTRYGISTTVDLEYARAVERTKEELVKEGFGVLSEIDISATLKNPEAALELTGNPEVREVAKEVKVRLERVLNRVAE
jgi:hypothetical protein